jgi:hypothetical protein|nr:MAG TPA: tail fiber protein [Caudoviricetes sp.]
MALPADFNKIYGSTATGGLTPISDVNYAKGWEFVGSNPPTKNDFSYLQNLSDLKSQWLYSNKLQRANPFGDIKADGAVQAALENLGLGDGSALPVGVPVPWPSATPPKGWLKCNGAPFSAEEYPKLAKAYPTNKLPDLRGEFIRGWDDGRGVDSARLLLSSQAASILEHNHEMHGWTGDPLMARDVYSSGSSVFAVQLSVGDGGILYSWKDGTGTTNDSKRMDRTNHVSSGAGDGSPRNIAFNYIVRAA